MLLKVAIKKLKESSIFEEFEKKNPDFYLAHAFTIIERVQSNWQIGYCGKKEQKVVVFEVGKEITQNPEEEIFKKTKSKVKELDMKKVGIGLERASDIANKLVEEKYSAEMISKTIVILQNLETQLYNLTLVTHSLNIINIKIDAHDGKILQESKQSILGLKKDD